MTNEETETAEDILETIRKDRAERIERLLETIADLNPETPVLEDCIEGYDKDGRIIYSVHNIIETLMERDEMSEEEAWEHYSFNIEGSYLGEYTPIFIYHE